MASGGLGALVLALVVALLPGPSAVPAYADSPELEVCWLDAQGNAQCPGDDPEPCSASLQGVLACPSAYPPAPLLNPGLMKSDSIDDNVRTTLIATQEQAIQNVLEGHDLPPSDRNAVLSWGRDEVEAQFVALVVTAATTAPANRTADQAILNRWVGGLVKAQAVHSAEEAGKEYALWAGLNLSKYHQKLAASQDELAAFLSTAPEAKADEPIDALDPRTSGWCDYKAPGPYSADYDGSYLPQCFGQCPSATGCAIPTPTYDDFVKWGQVDQQQTVGTREFQLSFAQLAGVVAGSVGAAAVGAIAIPTAVLGVGTMVKTFAPIFHTYMGIEFSSIVADAKVVDKALEAGLSAAEAADKGFKAAFRAIGSFAGPVTLFLDAINLVAVLTTALYVGIAQGLTILSAERLPLALASYIKQTQGAAIDPGELVKTQEGATTVISTVVEQMQPTPQVYPGREYVTAAGTRTQDTKSNCDNSLIPADAYTAATKDPKVIPVPGVQGLWQTVPIVPCLNPTPITEPSETGPHFAVRPRVLAPGQAAVTDTPTIEMVNDVAGYTATVGVRGHWFVENVSFDGDEAAGVTQRLRMQYTDWTGQLQSVYLFGNDADGYYFTGTEVSDTTLDPDTCLSTGECWKQDSIRFTGPDGVDYEATLEPYRSSTGTPTMTTATPLSGAPVRFDAGGFAPENAVGLVSYQWRFQKDGCGVPCVTFAGVQSGQPAAPAYGDPVPGATAANTWRTAGQYSVQLTATDSHGRSAVTTLVARVGGVAPQATLLPACAPTQQIQNCTSTTGFVGSNIAVMANISHPGTMDNIFVTVDWGDGTSTTQMEGPNVQGLDNGASALFALDGNTMRLFATHAYTEPGIHWYTVTTRAQAGDTGVTKDIVRVTGKQTITFDEMPDRKYGSKWIMHAVGGGSGMPVTFSTSTPHVCTSSGFNGETITMLELGQCTVTAHQAGMGIFLAADPVSRSFQVRPADLLVRADHQEKTYGAPNPTFTATFNGLKNGDTADDFTGLVVAGPPADSPVGEYDIVPSGASNPHYNVRFDNEHLVIHKAALTIAPDDQTRVYGGDTPAYTADFDGLVNGDTASDITGLRIEGAHPVAHVGDYRIEADGASNPNYEYHYLRGTETVTPRPVTVTADDITHQYGTTKAYRATYDGLAPWDSGLFGLKFAGAPAHAGAGSYPIVLSGGDNPDYAITRVSGTETVTPAPLTIRADNKTRPYGGPSPAYTTSFSGLQYDDAKTDFTGLTVTGAPASAGVGMYLIEPKGAINPNYDITFANGTETVTKAPLTVTAHDKSKVYGAADPEFTAKFDGLVNGDSEGAITGLELAAAPTGSDVGTYPIVPKNATNPNYDITFANGTETITPAPLTIKADDKTVKYGTVGTYTWKGQGWVNGDADATIQTAPVCKATIQGAAASVTTLPGAYLGAITCAGAADSNYTIGYSSGKLTVNPVITLSQTGLPSTVPHKATVDGQSVTLPTSAIEVGYGTAHSYSFPGAVVDANGVAYLTNAPAFTGPVASNVTVTAVYTTMTNVVDVAASSGGIDATQVTPLKTKWATVQTYLRAGNLVAARTALHDFATLVRSQSGKKIKKPTADALIAYAQTLYTSIGGTGTV